MQQVTLKGYTTYRNDRLNANNASGGVTIFIASQYIAPKVNIIIDLDTITITTYVPNVGYITISNIYIPPSLSISKAQFQYFLNFLNFQISLKMYKIQLEIQIENSEEIVNTLVEQFTKDSSRENCKLDF